MTQERPIIRFRYNEPFPFPVSTFQTEISTPKEAAWLFRLRDDHTNVFEIEAEGHPGYPVTIVKDRVHNIETRTTLKGSIVTYPYYEVIFNPYQLQVSGRRDRKFFLPFGAFNPNTSYSTTDEGELKIRIDRPPFTMRIILDDLWKATQGNDPTRVFLIQGGQVIEGIPTHYDRNFHHGEYKDFVALEDNWVDLSKSVTSILRRELLLPSDPEFYQTAKLLIGDRAPEI